MSTQLRGGQQTSGFSVFRPLDLANTLFPQTSRYSGLQTSIYQRDDGRKIAYLQRRFVPSPDNFEELRQHAVVEGDRADNLAYQYLGDAEQYWRILDANGVVDPNDLIHVGRKIRITLPQGIPGAPPHA